MESEFFKLEASIIPRKNCKDGDRLPYCVSLKVIESGPFPSTRLFRGKLYVEKPFSFYAGNSSEFSASFKSWDDANNWRSEAINKISTFLKNWCERFPHEMQCRYYVFKDGSLVVIPSLPKSDDKSKLFAFEASIIPRETDEDGYEFPYLVFIKIHGAGPFPMTKLFKLGDYSDVVNLCFDEHYSYSELKTKFKTWEKANDWLNDMLQKISDFLNEWNKNFPYGAQTKHYLFKIDGLVEESSSQEEDTKS